MIKRPKNTDSEQDLLQMQLEYMKEKEKNTNFQPAATVVKVAKIGKDLKYSTDEFLEISSSIELKYCSEGH